jgi:5-methylcytosine-specific restriction endonuclease McrA
MGFITAFAADHPGPPPERPFAPRCEHNRLRYVRRMIGKREGWGTLEASPGLPRFGFQCLDCGSSGWKDRSGTMISQWVAEKNCMTRMGFNPCEAGEYEDAISADIWARNSVAWDERLAARRRAWWVWYNRYLQSGAWQIKRYEVLSRDLHMCVECGETAEQVHHLTYERVGYEALNDLVSLCVACHQTAHGWDE